MTTDEKIGVIVERWIKSSRYKKVDIAKRLKIPQANISQFLKGTRPFPLPRIIQIIQLLNPSLADIHEINGLKFQNIALSMFGKTEIDAGLDSDQLRKLIKKQREEIIQGQGVPVMSQLFAISNLEFEKDGQEIDTFQRNLASFYSMLSQEKKEEFKRVIYDKFGSELKAWYDKWWNELWDGSKHGLYCRLQTDIDKDKNKKPETPDQGDTTR